MSFNQNTIYKVNWICLCVKMFSHAQVYKHVYLNSQEQFNVSIYVSLSAAAHILTGSWKTMEKE